MSIAVIQDGGPPEIHESHDCHAVARKRIFFGSRGAGAGGRHPPSLTLRRTGGLTI